MLKKSLTSNTFPSYVEAIFPTLFLNSWNKLSISWYGLIPFLSESVIEKQTISSILLSSIASLSASYDISSINIILLFVLFNVSIKYSLAQLY